MAHTKHVLKFGAIVNYFAEAEERKLIARGENAVESNHIKTFRFSPELQLLHGEVYASMKNHAYTAEVNLDEDGQIKSSSCTCPRGQFLCHHVAAVCIYGYHNISVTDVECQWSSSKPKDEPIKTIEELYVGKTHRSTDRNLNQEEIDGLLRKLHQFDNAVGFTWLLQPARPVSECQLLPDIEDFLFSEQYLLAEDKINSFIEAMKLNEVVQKNVAENTIGQAKNEVWLTCRKNRLTASNFGVVLASIARNRYPPSLYKRLSGTYNLEHVKSIQWGNINEQQALNEFVANTNKAVQNTGLWLDQCGFLGASPDGLVEEDAIIEVKCPYKWRNKSLRAELKNDKSYIIRCNEDDEFVVNESHEYFHQIQGNLAITGRQTCYLVIWSPDETIILEVEKDINWELNNMQLLKKFYLEQYVPYIIGNIIVD